MKQTKSGPTKLVSVDKMDLRNSPVNNYSIKVKEGRNVQILYVTQDELEQLVEEAQVHLSKRYES